MASTRRNGFHYKEYTLSPPPKKKQQKTKNKNKNKKTWKPEKAQYFLTSGDIKRVFVHPSVYNGRFRNQIFNFFFFLHEVHKARKKMNPDFVKKTEIRKCIHLSTGNRLLIKWSLKSWWSKYFVSGMFVAVRLLDTHTSGP